MEPIAGRSAAPGSRVRTLCRRVGGAVVATSLVAAALPALVFATPLAVLLRPSGASFLRVLLWDEWKEAFAIRRSYPIDAGKRTPSARTFDHHKDRNAPSWCS